jgi:hypothetical protein
VARCHEEEEEAKRPGRGGPVGFCSSAQPVEERERERERGGGHGRSSRRRAAPACPWVRGSRSAPAARRGRARRGQRRRHGRWEEWQGDAWARGAAQDCTAVACAVATARCTAPAAGSTREAASGVARRGEANARPVSGEASGEAARGSD